MCTKTSYSTEQFAIEDLKRFSKAKRRNRPTGVYKCSECNTWHLTSDNGVLFDKIRTLRQVISRLKLQHKEEIEYLIKENESLKNILKEIRLKYQPIKTKIHNGTNKRNKRNAR